RIDELSITHRHLITIEDNVVTGGAGSSINEYLAEKGHEITITNFGIPDQIISHGSQDELYAEIGLDKKSLEYKINEIYNRITSNKKIVE
ncbi:MAG: transketolase C-terminal domain-containing protein, partial [Pseudomonadota bacterium]|nr:transketolase C-terminal domain-containing protein [Pseudomonadota bacterium]